MDEIEGLAAALHETADSADSHAEAAIAQAEAEVKVAEIRAEVDEHISDNALQGEALRHGDESGLAAYRSEHEVVHAATNTRLDDMTIRIEALEDLLYSVEEELSQQAEEHVPENEPEPVEVDKPSETKTEEKPKETKKGGLYFT